ncbi:MAG: hypothetical protein R2698_05530 [Microthrixaceae bacterium]
MAQGRLDIVLAEFHARLEGRAESAHDLIRRIPEVVHRQGRAGGVPRPIRDFEPDGLAARLVGTLDGILAPGDLTVIQEFDVERLDAIAAAVSDYERSLSVRRAEVHRMIDDIQAEVVRRYRDGSATVDQLLVDEADH